MTLNRRGFLGSAGLALAGVATGVARPWETSEATAWDPTDWSAVRAQFALDADVIDLAALYLASHPTPVRDAIDAHRRGLDRSPLRYFDRHQHALESRSLDAAARHLEVEPGEIALTDSTTMGLGLLYGGIALEPGQEILTTEHDFYATHEAARLAAERAGATVRQIPLYDRPEEASAEEMVERVAGAIRPATRVLAVTWVHSGTGVKIPVRSIADAAAAANRGRDEADRLLVAVDGVHGFGVEDAGMPELGCDFFAAGCHKWLFGPRGTGVLWGRGSRWPEVRPTVPSFREGMGAWVRGRDPGPTTGARMSPGGFKPFEHLWALAPAFDFHARIGRGRVAERTHALARQLKEGLAAISGVRVVTPLATAVSAGIVCFDLAGRSAGETVGQLAERGVLATVTPYAGAHARLAPSIRNTPSEIDQTIAAVRALA